MTEAGKFLHIPVLDRMRESLKDGGWDEALTANDLKSMLDQGIDVALRQDPSAAVSKNLEVEIEGRQAYIEGVALQDGVKFFLGDEFQKSA